MENKQKQQIGKGAQKTFKNTIKYLKKEEYRKLKENIDDFRDKIIITLLYSSGCRVSEVAKMKIDHIDFEAGFVHIPAENTKTKSARVVRVGKEVLNDIKAYLKINKGHSEFLFGSSGKPPKGITDRMIRYLVHHYAVKADIQKIYAHNKDGHPLYTVTPHTLRHTHIVHALMDSVPITAVQKQVGHKNLSTTQIYCDLAPEQVKQAYDKAGFE